MRRLEGYGKLLCLVMGTFQEGSKDLHHLLDLVADSKLRARGLARGSEGSAHKKSVILMNLRRELSTAGAKAQSACLLGRVARMGEGHRVAAKTGRNVSFQICNLDLAGRQLERATTIMFVKYIFKSGF